MPVQGCPAILSSRTSCLGTFSTQQLCHDAIQGHRTLQCKLCCCDGCWCLGFSTCLVLMTRPLLHLIPRWCTIEDGAHSRHYHPYLPGRLENNPRVQAPALLLVTHPITSTVRQHSQLWHNVARSGALLPSNTRPLLPSNTRPLVVSFAHGPSWCHTHCACEPLCSTTAIPRHHSTVTTHLW
jgi:hypothetical protein